jgi:hypothetical protein
VKKYFCFVLGLLLLTQIPTAQGANGLHWIEEYRLEDYSTNQLVLEWSATDDELVQNAPVLAGSEYRLSLLINVRQTVDNAVLELRLSDLVQKRSETVFWHIETVELPLTEGYNPAERIIRFNHTQGVYRLAIVGMLDRSLTTQGSGVVFHKPVDLTFVTLIGPAQTLYDEITVNVIDNRIDDYRRLKSQKEAELAQYRQSNVDPAYIQLYEKFLNVAISEAELGLMDNAINLMNNLQVEAPPVETGPSWQEQYFLLVVGGLAALFALSAVLFIRTRTRMGFVTMIVEDQIREMEALQSRASRIDRSLAQRLQEINDRLKEAEKA